MTYHAETAPFHAACPTVYLSGPISGLRYEDGVEWRERICRALAPEIACYSPLRAHGHLDGLGVLRGSYPDHPLTGAAGLTTRDRFDCMRCDLLLVNLLGTVEVSVGTCIELGWADAWRKPVVLVMEADGNVHDHPLVRGVAGFHVPTLEEAMKIVRAVLLP